MNQVKRDSKSKALVNFNQGKKRGLHGPADNSLLDVIVRTDSNHWKVPKKRGLLTTLKLLLTYLIRKIYETFKNVPQKLKKILQKGNTSS